MLTDERSCLFKLGSHGTDFIRFERLTLLLLPSRFARNWWRNIKGFVWYFKGLSTILLCRPICISSKSLRSVKNLFDPTAVWCHSTFSLIFYGKQFHLMAAYGFIALGRSFLGPMLLWLFSWRINVIKSLDKDMPHAAKSWSPGLPVRRSDCNAGIKIKSDCSHCETFGEELLIVCVHVKPRDISGSPATNHSVSSYKNTLRTLSSTVPLNDGKN